MGETSSGAISLAHDAAIVKWLAAG